MTTPSKPNLLLCGEELALAQPRRERLDTYHRWETDPTTLLGFGTPYPMAWEAREAGWERQRTNANYQKFEVVRIDDQFPVGMVTLAVNPHQLSAEYILLVAPEHRGHGYATKATILALDWAFHLGAVRSVWLKVLEPNIAGMTAYEKAGFRIAGRLRNAGYWLGNPVDEIIMDALPSDFAGPSRVTGPPGSVLTPAASHRPGSPPNNAHSLTS